MSDEASRFDGTPAELFGLPIDGGPEYQAALDRIEESERRAREPHSARTMHAILLEAGWVDVEGLRKAKAEAWDEGHRLTAPHGDQCDPTCLNPYRKAPA